MENEVKKDESLPLVSVVVPCYNHEKYVKETIESIINQTYKNIELIVIDDGSKDNSVSVIQELADKYGFTFIHRPNKGLSATLNEMVNWSNGKYFSAIASDDILITNKISLLVEKLENLDENYAAAFGDATFIDDKSNEVYIDYKTGEYSTKEKGGKSFLDYYTLKRDFDYKDESEFGSYKTLLGGNYLPAMSAVIKLDKIKEVNAWTSGNTIEDWEMWLKLSKKYKFAYVDKPVALYRWHDSNTCKLLNKDLHYDTIKLLLKNKDYASSNNSYRQIYYERLAGSIVGLMRYSYKDFFLAMVINSIDINFLKGLLSKISKKIKIF